VPFTSCKHELCPLKGVQAQAVFVTDNFNQKHCLVYIYSHLPNWEFFLSLYFHFKIPRIVNWCVGTV
jgi:hypothetical protein